MLTKSQIRAAKDVKHEDVPCPEWKPPEMKPEDAFVRIQGLNAKQRVDYEESMIRMRGKGRNLSVERNVQNAQARLVQMCAVDENGESLFTVQDLEWLGEKSAVAMNRCFEVAQRLSGLSAEDVEELMGNSGAAPSAA